MGGVVLGDEGGERLAVVGGVFHRVGARPLHDAAAGDEHVDRRVHLVADVGDDVGVDVAPQRRDALEGDLGEHFELVAAVERELELLRLGVRRHLFAQQAVDVSLAALQKAHRRLDPLAVLLGRNFMRAGRGAAVDVVVEAGLFGLGRDRRRADAHAEGHVDDLEHVADAHAAHVRAEILVPLDKLARYGEGGIGLGDGDLDIRVRLVVFEQDVVLRLIFFDEVVFEGEGVDLGLGDDVVEVVDVGDHRLHLFGLGRRMEVLAHPVFEDARLADVDHVFVRVEHDIDAGLIRQQF